MRFGRLVSVLVLAAAALLCAPVQALPETALRKTPVPKGSARAPGGLPYNTSHDRLGDFDAMRKRRLVRVLVVYNKTNYFIDRGTPRGITAEAFKFFEEEESSATDGRVPTGFHCAVMRTVTLCRSGAGDCSSSTTVEKKPESISFERNSTAGPLSNRCQ